jgi:Ca-activated chloride channel family protein
MRFAGVAMGLSTLLLGLPQTQHDAQDQSVFRGGVDVVALNVTVTDRRQQFVDGLGRRDFTVYEDGVAQTISYFALERLPLDLAVVIDLSSSMGPIMSTLQSAATGFVRALQPVDRVSVIAIRTRAELLHELSHDTDGAIDAIRRSSANGKTALYDSLYVALDEMARNRREANGLRRQAIVLLSDGQDTASVVAYDDVLERVRESFISVYTVTLVSKAEAQRVISNAWFPEALYRMKSFAVDSGGRAFVSKGAGELKNVYHAIADELAHQYTVGYVSTNRQRDGAFRRVDVRILDRGDLVARARPGYVAPRSSGGGG